MNMSLTDQGRTQEGLNTLRENLNRSESTAQIFFGGGPDPPGYTHVTDFHLILNLILNNISLGLRV